MGMNLTSVDKRDPNVLDYEFDNSHDFSKSFPETNAVFDPHIENQGNYIVDNPEFITTQVHQIHQLQMM